jgi:tRNA nucleotidyltransferase (CCA-adding enzyme)
MMMVIDYAAERGFDLCVRFAALMHDLGKGVTPAGEWPAHHGHEGLGLKLIENLSRRLKVPNDCRDLALMTAREHGNVSRAEILKPNTMVKLFERCDAFRKPQRFEQMLLASECDFRGRGDASHDFATRPYPQAPLLLQSLGAARGIDAGVIAGRYNEAREKIPEAIHRARVAAVRRVHGSTGGEEDVQDD